MYTLPIIECPFCSNEGNFTVLAIDGYERIEEKSLDGKTVVLVKADTLARCPKCRNACLVIVETTEEHYKQIKEAIQNFQFIPRISYLKVLKVYPEPQPVYSHPSLPDKVREAFEDLQRMLKQKFKPYFIVGGCRAVLEAAIAELGGEGERLIDKINDLLKKGIITKPLADWAHQIRVEGNVALHELLHTEITPEEAEELVEFVKLFLVYTFELPARIQERRKLTHL